MARGCAVVEEVGLVQLLDLVVPLTRGRVKIPAASAHTDLTTVSWVGVLVHAVAVTRRHERVAA